MRHRKKGKKLGRSTKQRRALYQGLLTSFFEYGYLNTTLGKAKAIRPLAERVITLAGRGDLASKRKIFSRLTKKTVGRRLLDSIAPTFSKRKGGYTRIVKLGQRRGDRAEMARLELVEAKKPATTVESTERLTGAASKILEEKEGK